MTKQMTESTSLDDYLTKCDNPRTNRQNNFRNQFSRVIPTSTELNWNDNLSLKKDWKSYYHRPAILQSPESIFKCRAHENLYCNECNIFGDEVRFSEPLVYNALENPDRMQWSSFDSGIRLPEPPEWMTKVEISEHTEVGGTISEQYTDVCKLENNNEIPESHFKSRAHKNLQCNIFGDEVRFSEPLVYNFNSNALENPDRMQWSSFDSGIRLSEPPEWIPISEHTEVVGTISEHYTDVSKLENDSDTERRRRWERNEMDYLGQDSFQNILAKLRESLIG